MEVTTYGKSVYVQIVEIFSVHNFSGATLLKLINGEIIETCDPVENFIRHSDWKNHGRAEIVGQTVFFCRDQYNFDEIIDVIKPGHDESTGLDIILFGGYIKTYFISNRSEIFDSIKKNKMRIEIRNSTLLQISGSGYNEKIHSRIPISEIVEISPGRRREMPIQNITLRTFTQLILFGELKKN